MCDYYVNYKLKVHVCVTTCKMNQKGMMDVFSHILLIAGLFIIG